MSTAATPTPPSTFKPPPPEYYDASWCLISQGAEARVWEISSFLTTTYGNSTGSVQLSTTTSSTNDNNSGETDDINSMAVICKERFTKAYRHPVLDATLTKARTKAEARSLVRCRRAGVSVPIVISIDLPSTNQNYADGSMSACLFLEKISGCTVRDFLTVQTNMASSKEVSKETDQGDCENTQSPPSKKSRIENDTNDDTNQTDIQINQHSRPQQHTRLDKYSMKLAYATGTAIAKMHNANIIHGDLTTSNIMLRNPPSESAGTTHNKTSSMNHNNQVTSSNSTEDVNEWKPDIVLIDFGLSSTSNDKTKQKKKKKDKNGHFNVKVTAGSCHEERAVDLYVLERAFSTTHVGSDPLVQELLRAYKSTCSSSDAVFQRLSEVRMRGRKRECFG